jgi:hypothetical protein
MQVTRWVSYKKHKLLTIFKHLGLSVLGIYFGCLPSVTCAQILPVSVSWSVFAKSRRTVRFYSVRFYSVRFYSLQVIVPKGSKHRTATQHVPKLGLSCHMVIRK